MLHACLMCRVMVPVTDVWVADMASALHPGCTPALLPAVGPPTYTGTTCSHDPGWTSTDGPGRQSAGGFHAGRQAVRVMLTDDLASLGLQPGDLVSAHNHPESCVPS